MSGPRTLYDKIWDSHLVAPETDETPAILYIDRHLIHEVTSPQAFTELNQRGLKVRRPDRTTATCDHSTPTLPALPDGTRPYKDDATRLQVEALEKNTAEHGVELFGWGSAHRGIVHVMGPELGLTLPGSTLVCGDSHTATHGAFGVLAFGIGTTEVGHVLATQCLLQRKSKTLAVVADGALAPGVTGKDLILAVIANIGIGGGTGHVIEYQGAAIRALSMEARMTVCNMSIEGGARAGLVAPDDTTFDFLRGRPRAPQGADFDAAVERWRTLAPDAGAEYDRTVTIDASALAPRITWGADPSMGVAVDEPVPTPATDAARDAVDYMRLPTGKPLLGEEVQKVFIGSCTNGRLSDLEEAARVLVGRKVADGVHMLIVPGSEEVKRQAEEKGLHKVFAQAGADWREPGCSMCLGMNGDIGAPGDLVVSTSNRNFKGRQGPGVRTVLASPFTAAAAAVNGAVSDPRPLLEGRNDR